MHPSHRLIKQIKRSAGGEIGKEGLASALAILEADTPIGALMSTIANREFRNTMLDVARDRPRSEMLAWMTVAAAGPLRTRRALASRAVDIVAPYALVDVLLDRGEFDEACVSQSEAVPSEDEWGAWLLLSQLRRSEVRGVAQAKPSLRRRLQAARRRPRGSINPQLRSQLSELGLV